MSRKRGPKPQFTNPDIVQARFDQPEIEAIDKVRGDLSRSKFVRQATLFFLAHRGSQNCHCEPSVPVAA